jgi:curved DNA-binding protein CbpA
MSIFRPFIEARALLGVPDDADGAAIKRAYRKLVLAHPPDSDPEGFRRVRDAYEMLQAPLDRVQEILFREEPAIDPPPPPPPVERAPPVPLALVLLRIVASQVDAEALLRPSAQPTRSPEGTPPR